MADAIDWRAFSVDVQARWERPADMKADLGLSQSTLMAAWHGKPVGVLPMLRACDAMGAHPLRYLAQVGTRRMAETGTGSGRSPSDAVGPEGADAPNPLPGGNS